MTTQKTIIASKSVKGFTLVELIVVITILAILGTIAFVSLQGYSGSARDSKRTSDVRSLVSAMSVKQTEGIGYLNMVTSVAASRVTGITIAGNAATAPTNYEAGSPNFTTIGANGENFKDPRGVNYVVGATSRVGNAFQVAATLENDSAPKALVMGNYNARPATTVTMTVPTGSTLTLASADIGKFKKNDFVSITGGTPATNTISKISSDGLTITWTAPMTVAGTAVVLAAETGGLIADNNTVTASGASDPVLNDSLASLPY